MASDLSRRRGRRVIWAGRLAWAVLAAATIFQPSPAVPSTEFSESVEVAVTEIVVRVTAQDGRPLTGLTAEEFEVEEDGHRVKITNFEEVDRSSRQLDPAESEIAPPPSEPSPTYGQEGERALLQNADDYGLFFVIYLDDVHTRTESRNGVLEQLDALLNSRQNDKDRMMVVRYDHGLEVVQSWTPDSRTVAAALQGILERPAQGDRRDQEMRSGIEAIHQLVDKGKALGAECYFVDEMESSASTFAQTAHAEVEASLRALGELVNALGGLPGRKAVLYVSDGLSVTSGQELFGLISKICPPTVAMGHSARGSAGVGSSALAWGGHQFSAHDTLHRLATHANGRDVTIYTLQAHGVRPPANWLDGSTVAGPAPGVGQEGSTTRGLSKRLDRQEGLFSMAAETGGKAILNANDLEAPLEALEQDLDAYYVLGYAPRRRPDQREHTVKVRVQREGVQVRHKGTRRDRTGAELASDRTLATLWYGLDHNPLAAEIQLGEPRPADDHVVHVPLMLRIPLGSIVLVPGDEHATGHLTIFLATEDAVGRKPPPIRLTLPVRAALSAFLQPEGHFVNHPITVALREGSPHLAVGIWDDVGGRYAVLYKKLDV